MHLVQGIMSSNPDAKIIQMTKSDCGPFFDVAPVDRRLTASWAEGCLEFTGKVREWLQSNNTVKYVVVSSPFISYISHYKSLLYRSGDLVATNSDLGLNEFLRTLAELESMGITPIVFSPLPMNGVDLGRCLSRSECIGLDLDECNFRVDEIPKYWLKIYSFLEKVEENYRVVRLDKLICDSYLCETHIGSTFIYRDKFHLSEEGSAELGKVNDFYRIIVDGYSN
jgi:hypothetical protein